MATAWITEYREAALTGAGVGVPAGKEPALAHQTVTFTTATSSAAFNANTRLIRIQCDAAAHLKFGPVGQTATTSHTPVNANAGEYFGVNPGDEVSVLAQ